MSARAPEMREVLLSTHEMQRCFRIRYQNRVGTAFLHGAGSNTFFVTASHNLRGIQAGENVLIQQENGWLPAKVAGVWFHPEGYDACAFSTENLSFSGEVQFDGEPATYPGGPLRFLGFPHGLTDVKYPGIGFPIPLVRTAYLSGVALVGGRETVILDGFNNPGFSGGPVFGATNDGQAALCGLISGYRNEAQSHSGVFRKTEDGGEEEVPNFYVKPNSGMIYCVGLYQLRQVFSLVTVFNPSS